MVRNVAFLPRPKWALRNRPCWSNATRRNLPIGWVLPLGSITSESPTPELS